MYLKVANTPLANELLDDGASPNEPYHGKYLLSMLCEGIWRLKNDYTKSTNNNEKAEYMVDIKNYTPKVADLVGKIIGSKGFNPNAVDYITGFAPVHWVGELGEKAPALLQALKDLGADINKVDAGGRSVLIWYSNYNAPSIVKKLLGLGANANIQDIKRDTAAHVLFSKEGERDPNKQKSSTLEALLNHDNKPPYNPTLKNYQGNTAQDVLKSRMPQSTNEDLNNCNKLFDDYKKWYDEAGVKLLEGWHNEQAEILGKELDNFDLYE